MKSSVTLLTLTLCVLMCGACIINFRHVVMRLEQLEEKMQKMEKQFEDQKIENQGNYVAFGASLRTKENFGLVKTNTPLCYENVFANTGAYNPETGMFTAPVKGIYYFSFSGPSFSTKQMVLQLMKNGRHVVTAGNHASGSHFKTTTNGMTLTLEKGDQVYMMRFSTYTWIYDNTDNDSTFIGFLLFPLETK